MSEHDELRESVPAWVLGALDEEEADRVEKHVRECAECQADVARLRPAAVAIGLASPIAAMPAGLRDRIVERARQPQEISKVETAPRPARPAIVRRPPPRTWVRLPAQAVAAMIALLAGAAAGAVAGRLTVGPPAAEVARYQLAGHGGMSGASGEVIDLRQQGIAFVTFSHLPAPPDGKVYELWLIKSGANPVDAGVFVPDANGATTVLVARPLTGYTTVAVTSEAAPDGAQAPTQQPELYGSTG